MQFLLSSLLLAAVSILSGDALPHTFAKRAVINHDAVVGFPETVPSGIVGQLYLKYKPFLKVVNGCVPFPAVEADGDVSGGLKTSGSPEGGCSKSTGQVYARSGWSADGTAFAIIVTLKNQLLFVICPTGYVILCPPYMPKDSPSAGLGHRHDWENIVVWLSSNAADATLLGVAASQHSGYVTSTSPSVSGPGGPRISYQSIWPVNHALFFTNTVGGQQPLIAWESLTQAARDTLQNYNFVDANVSFKDGNFESNLVKAAL